MSLNRRLYGFRGFLDYLLYESMGANDTRVWCRSILICGPRGIVGRINVVNHYFLNIEAVGSWFQKIFLKLFPSKCMEAKYPESLVNLEPRGICTGPPNITIY